MSIVEGPLRVFLSHTSELRKYPQERSFVAAAEQAVIRAEDAVLDMAVFHRAGGQARQYCGSRCGGRCVRRHHRIPVRSPVRDEPELSYTELEFDAATEVGLPRLVFLLDEDAVLPLPRTACPIPSTRHGSRRSVSGSPTQDDGPAGRVTGPAGLLLFQALTDLLSRPLAGMAAGALGVSGAGQADRPGAAAWPGRGAGRAGGVLHRAWPGAVCVVAGASMGG